MSKRKAIMAVWLILCDILASCISVEVTEDALMMEEQPWEINFITIKKLEISE